MTMTPKARAQEAMALDSLRALEMCMDTLMISCRITGPTANGVRKIITDIRGHLMDVYSAPSPAINQESDPYQVYLEVANSCADPWEKTSMRNNAARFKEALEKHAAAVKHSQEK